MPSTADKKKLRTGSLAWREACFACMNYSQNDESYCGLDSQELETMAFFYVVLTTNVEASWLTYCVMLFQRQFGPS